jgi:hypothetical protein
MGAFFSVLLFKAGAHFALAACREEKVWFWKRKKRWPGQDVLADSLPEHTERA